MTARGMAPVGAAAGGVIRMGKHDGEAPPLLYKG
jgi:hypothetical protein